MSYDARAIANFFLDYAAERRLSLTKMALLKLIYFAHGWYLTKFDTPLVKNRFEAWKDGPVVRAVYDAFSGFTDNPITDRAKKFDPVTASYSLVEYDISLAERRFLESIFQAYGHLHAIRLSHLTHEPGSPWDEIWNASGRDTHPGMQITDENIRSHFSRRHYLQPKQ